MISYIQYFGTVAGGVVVLCLFSLFLWRSRRAVEFLSRSNAGLASCLSTLKGHTNQGFILFNETGITGVSAAIEESLGYRKHELEGRAISLLVPDADLSGGEQTVSLRRADGGCVTVGIKHVVSGQQHFLFFEAAIPVVKDDRSRESALDLVEGVVIRIVRELEDILTMINGYTELALGEVAGSAAIRKDLQEIANASDAASHLVQHLLAFSRNQVIPVERLDLNAMIEVLRGELGTMQVEFCAENLFVFANAECLRKIILIFCGSAQYRVGSATPVQVMVGRRQLASVGYATITISDSGPALPSATLEHVFEPLFLDRESVGVDLSAIYGLVRTFGGNITVSSDANRGTVFEILIPLAEDIAGERVPRPASTHERGAFRRA